MAWVTGRTTELDRQRTLGPRAHRVHMIEYAWLHRMRNAQVFAYRFEAAEFIAYGDELDPHAFVTQHPVRALVPAEPIGDRARSPKNPTIVIGSASDPGSPESTEGVGDP